MQEPFIFVLAILATFVLFTVLGTAVMGVLAYALGVEVREATFGAGPKLCRFHIKSIPVNINWLLFTSYVKLCDNRFDELRGEHDNSLQSVHPVLRVLMLMSGVVIAFIPMELLAASEILARMLSAIPQVIQGALSPFDYAQELLSRGQAYVTSVGYAFPLAVILLKMATFQLIPVAPNLGLGQAIASLRSSAPGKYLEIWGTITTLLYMALICSWFVALVYYAVI